MVVSFPFNPPPLKKVKLFICSAILLEFETQDFHMFTNNNWEYNFELEVPFFLPPDLKKS